MKGFAQLYAALDATNSTQRKVAAMVTYLETAPAGDAAWAIWLLSGQRLKRTVPPRRLLSWAQSEAGLPEWLVDASMAAVGDLAETVSLLLEPTGETDEVPLATWIEDRLMPLAGRDEDVQRAALAGYWRTLPTPQTFLLNKLLTGALRVGVSHGLVVRALTQVSAASAPVLRHRLMGDWTPTAAFYENLLATPEDASERPPSQPYPFFLAHPLERGPDALGPVGEWQLEWKWDGIRAQVIRRAGETWIWSRGEELVTERFPEVVEATAALPDGTVLDGELMGWKDGAPLHFGQLQRRIGRKTVGKKLRAEVPVHLVVYDLLEADGVDLREQPLTARRARLESLLSNAPPQIHPSPIVTVETWEQAAACRSESRDRLVEGLMVKRRDGPYRAGRPRGDWWKWKIEPLTLDCVLVYAQGGSGRRANLFTDYTFAVWKGDALVTLAKAYSGLTDDEIREVDRWIRANTTERFGPVRAVEPTHVFELAFDDVRRSKRHKSGYALRFPRMARWRSDKKPADANRIEDVDALLRMLRPDEA